MSIDEYTNTIQTGDALELLEELPAESVNMAMTSPPYWNLRDYGHDDQLGLEETADEYVQNIADVMDGLKRVLRDDGSLWLNLGDTYDDKDLQQIPARVALELQRRGWILRNRVTWVKPNPMPASVKDRLNTSTEAIFHFSKSKDYHYDLDAIREPHETSTNPRQIGGAGATEGIREGNGKRVREDRDYETACHPKGKNPGDTLNISICPFPDAHFAVYPPELCEKPIKATCPRGGVVLDPFAGAGTTCLKAKELHRKFIGVELNPEYADMARARCGLAPEDPSHVNDDDSQQALSDY